MIQLAESIVPHPTSPGYTHHVCATTNVEPRVETWVVLAPGETPSATLREVHQREVREMAAERIAKGTHHLTPSTP